MRRKEGRTAPGEGPPERLRRRARAGAVLTADQSRDDDSRLAECVEDYRRRRALGERPPLDEFVTRAGGRAGELRRLLAVMDRVDALDPAPAESRPFPRLFGEYTLVRELGRGAMGVVYEAVHRPLQRTVALKVLRTGLDTDAVALERFRREARACAQVRHPNVVEVYDAGCVEDQPYYSMPLLRGRTVRDLAREGALPGVAELCRGFAGIADALRVLHEAGIVHRDIKPSNVLVADDGSMVLADFGLAQTAQSERVTMTGQALGTPLYMSPEQVRGSTAEVDGRSDVYGLGATMYEVFTGSQLFRAVDMAAVARKILTELPAPLRAVRPELPEALERIVMKCLEKAREDRYPTAAALRDDLRNLADGRPVVGRPVSRLGRAVRRARPLVPAAAVALVLAAAGAWLWTHREATLVVSCWPTASVAIDGVSRGDTPVEIRLPPGPHTLTLAQGGFAPRTEAIDLAAGARRDVRQVLIAVSPDDPEALARIGRELGIGMAALEPLSSTRGADDEAVTLVWPRGEVRIEDVASWRVDVTADFPGPGRVEFRRGDAVLHSDEFAPTRTVTEGTLPDALLGRLEPGDVVTWRYVPAKGEPVVAQFTLTTKDVGPALRRVEEATRKQDPALARRVAARLLLDGGLHVAAYRAARGAAPSGPRSRVDWLVMQHALDRLGLRGAGPWNEVVERLPESR